MNPYHCYLNLPFEIQRPSIFDIEHTVAKHEKLAMHLPEAQRMIEFLTSMNLICEQLEYFYTPPSGGKILIHSDNYLDNMVKFNITWGPDNGVVRWWHCDQHRQLNIDSGNSTYGESQTGHRIYVADEADSVMVHEANTNRLSMLNVGAFHSTYNPGNYGRYTLCFVVCHPVSMDRVQWQDAVEIFKDYLETN